MTTATQTQLSPAARERADRILEAGRRGVREAVLEHARLGRSVVEGDDNGGVRWITPVEIFARFGLDENGKPKG